MAQVLVTGYGGFLGAAVTRQLIEAGFRVRGIARSAYPQLAGLGVECLQGDVSDRETVMQAAAGCEAIIHTAAKAGVWGPWTEYYRMNTLATSHLLEAAHRHAVEAFVLTSSPSVTFAGKPQSGVDERAPYPHKWLCYYPQTKALAERAVLDAGRLGKIKTCALRPHLVWGPGDPHLFPRVIDRARSGNLRRVGTGTNLIDVTHVESAARAHVLALNQLRSDSRDLNGQALFITDDCPVECWAWIARILDTAGVRVPSRSISYRAAYRLGGYLEALYSLLRIRSEPPMTRFVAAQLGLDHYFSIERAKGLLDYHPQLDVAAEFERCRPWLEQLGRGQSDSR